ncbi:patatin-like phospholipase family protein [Paenarthrobacter sp. JL.01a]|uniref:patatin-like phospholipase family protein n=1 Tax=Paenarthrobacter sp. JL.01a TaxID=2979324 RepID=UPI0021CAD2AD|nr:patatin-like phospholipase family protein [Paenarthrobacter sp. JL.01a]UXM91326.1 patatin-like phospholipase family protein [Paenarthrobacter sp. JL.01a]
MNTSPLPAPPAPEASAAAQVLPTLDASARIPQGERALVLGGGGSTGNAWLIGVVAGLYDGGVDVTRADLTVGTSAGSTAAAQLAGAAPADLLKATLGPVPLPPRQSSGAGPAGSGAPAQKGAGSVTDHMERTGRILDASRDMADMRRRMGAAALDLAAAMDGASKRWRATVSGRLPQQQWPERAVLLTAVDAETGEPVVFDRHSGVDLVDAVAASCASGFAYSIGTKHYIDGGYRTNAENADLAAGYPRVLVLSPFGGRTRTPGEWGMDLRTQVSALQGNGSRVRTIVPESDSEHMFGVNAMDLSLRPAAARTGYEQGLSLADELGGFWG